MDKHRLSKEFYEQLTEKLLPFWSGLRDDEHGGFYGHVDYDLNIDKSAFKGCILNSRILWFFSNASMLFRGEEVKTLKSAEKNARLAAECLDNAKHAYEFLTNHCIDRENGGVYWSVNCDGTVSDDVKHTYNQAFAIYALSSYFDATNDKAAYDEAVGLMKLVDAKCRDSVGYNEVFNRDFTPYGDNQRLSDNGIVAEKTMNTLLHVFEAYTELLRVTKKLLKETKKGTEEHSIYVNTADTVADRMRYIIDLVLNKVYNPILRRQEVYFDKKYKSMIDVYSYGHDIEASWLIDRGLDVMDDIGSRLDIGSVIRSLAECVYEKAYVDHSVITDCDRGVENRHRVWWVQAESVVGFMNAGRMCETKGENLSAQHYYEAAGDVWNFIREKMTDLREGSEWFWEVDECGEPIVERPIADEWKCPYHNGRMCIEMIRRLG